jgi:hypothetical protein
MEVRSYYNINNTSSIHIFSFFTPYRYEDYEAKNGTPKAVRTQDTKENNKNSEIIEVSNATKPEEKKQVKFSFWSVIDNWKESTTKKSNPSKLDKRIATPFKPSNTSKLMR